MLIDRYIYDIAIVLDYGTLKREGMQIYSWRQRRPEYTESNPVYYTGQPIFPGDEMSIINTNIVLEALWEDGPTRPSN